MVLVLKSLDSESGGAGGRGGRRRLYVLATTQKIAYNRRVNTSAVECRNGLSEGNNQQQ